MNLAKPGFGECWRLITVDFRGGASSTAGLEVSIQVWLKESQPVSGATAAREEGCVTLCSDPIPVSLHITEPSDIFFPSLAALI